MRIGFFVRGGCPFLLISPRSGPARSAALAPGGGIGIHRITIRGIINNGACNASPTGVGCLQPGGKWNMM